MIRLTVIVATYNRADSVLRTLETLAAQTLDKELWEVVVVNNNSKDDTAQKVEAFIAENSSRLNVRLFLETEQGVSPSCNRGYREGVGEYFVIVDDDEEIDPNLAEAYLELFDTYPDAAEAGGEIIPLYDYPRPKWLSKYTEVLLTGRFSKGRLIKLFRKGEYPFGGNMGVRRSIVENYGLFSTRLGRTGDSLMGGEEKDFAARLHAAGEKIYYLPAAKIYHIIPREKMTRSYMVKLARMVGSTERLRLLGSSRAAYAKRLFGEVLRWGATLVLGLWYTLTLRPSKAGYLILMRWNITRGLLCGGK